MSRVLWAMAVTALFLAPAGCAKSSSGSSAVATVVGPTELKAALAASRGHPIILYFWATWCKTCIPELKSLAQLQAKHAAQNLRVICVSIDSTGDEMRTALVRYSYQEAGPLYGAYISRDAQPRAIMTVVDRDWLEVVPVTYMINKDGQQAGRFVGSRALRDLRKKLTAIL